MKYKNTRVISRERQPGVSLVESSVLVPSEWGLIRKHDEEGFTWWSERVQVHLVERDIHRKVRRRKNQRCAARCDEERNYTAG